MLICKPRPTPLLALSILIASLITAATFAAPTPNKPTPILPLDDVRIGMKGYGLTVFHGAKIEPFAVEVISVMRDFGPKRGAIWIRCPDPRMQQSGPVQGMSGSPIYLWTDDQPHQLGQGGRLIGAFAFGFFAATDCYVGVQPIELMRDVNTRALQDNAQHQPQPQSLTDLPAQLSNLLRAWPQSQTNPSTPWRAHALLRYLQHHPAINQATSTPTAPSFQPASPTLPLTGKAMPMTMPMAVPSLAIAQSIAPILTPLGILPVAASTHAYDAPFVAGRPPPGVDPQAIRLEPGSVLSIPLAFGDMDLSAIGTVTDVLPDGRVLAFGHAMFGQGPVAFPMATGFVHLIIPSRLSSFKLGGSAVIKGAVVYDENSAVVGSPNATFQTAPIQITVNLPTSHDTYHYQIAHHKDLTPVLAAIITMQSLSAKSQLPIENMLRLKGTFHFSDNHTLHINTLGANVSPRDMIPIIFPPIATMTSNPHQPLTLEAINLTADIQPTLSIGSIVNAQIDHDQLAPGDTLAATLHIQPYAKPLIKQRVELTLPQSLPDGDYDLIICDSQTYAQLLFDARPHLLTTNSVDDVQNLLQLIMDIPDDALHIVLQLPKPSSLAIGRMELPTLPSSRRAIINTPTSTLATPYIDWVEKTIPLDLRPQGSTQFSITVSKDHAK